MCNELLSIFVVCGVVDMVWMDLVGVVADIVCDLLGICVFVLWVGLMGVDKLWIVWISLFGGVYCGCVVRDY